MKEPQIVLSFRVSQETENLIEYLAKKSFKKKSELLREIVEEQAALMALEKYSQPIAKIVGEEIKRVITPQVERLAKISSKTGIMAGRSAYLNAQVLVDLVPVENRKDVADMWEKAKSKAVKEFKIPYKDYVKE